jgi:GT2 family glycosyltransferase
MTSSIVIYHHTVLELKSLIDELVQCKEMQAVYVVDNSSVPTEGFSELGVTYIFNNKNLGYGAAHNIAIRQAMELGADYHLIINPDIECPATDMEQLVQYMNLHPDVGHLMPKVVYPNGRTQYLCKLLPTPFDLIFRRFLPASWTEKQRARFELHASGYDKVMDVPYLSGCFMLLRVEALKKIGLFDERFFMYPEDIDLTRRIHQHYRTVFYPHVSVIHHHAQESYKSGKLLWIHITNMIRYFNKWGWCWDAERKAVNRKTLDKLLVK